MNQQREVIYGLRQSALQGDDLHEDVLEMLGELVEEKCAEVIDRAESWQDWPLRELAGEFELIAMQPIKPSAPEGRDAFAAVVEDMTAEVGKAYAAKEAEFTPELMRQIERFIFLRTLDAAWRDHLYEVDHLREGIGRQSVAGKDPLIEYKKEAFRLFEEILVRIRRETVRNLFKVSLVEEPQARAQAPAPRAMAYRHEAASAYAAGAAPAGEPQPAAAAAGGPPPAGSPYGARRPVAPSYRGSRSGEAPRSAATIPAPAAAGRSTRSAICPWRAVVQGKSLS